MPTRRRLFGTLAVLLCLGLPRPAAVAQNARRGDIELPPVSWTCPMHPDIVETKEGRCPLCRMNLVGVRLDSVWSCPVHAVIAEAKPGACPIDRRALIQVTVALTWICPDHPEVDHATPGTCGDGGAMVARRTPRPHGNHNPQHGGLFFMAPDNWHHLEGTFPRPGVFQLYVYDDYSRALPLDRVKRIKARVVTKETIDSRTGVTKEISRFPLVLKRRGQYFEANVDARLLPAQLTAKVRLKDGGPEYRFDFTFATVSKEPVEPSSVPRLAENLPPALAAPPASSDAARVVAPPAADVAPIVAPPTPTASGVERALLPSLIPDTVEGILANLKLRAMEIRALVGRGAFAEVYVPAFQAKDMAIALEARVEALPAERRSIARPAIGRLVRTAWLLDAFGDTGNRQQVAGAYSLFTSAIAELESAFASAP